jgi:hypothetical protein
VVSLNFQVGVVIGWIIQFRIRLVPTQNTFGEPHSTKNEKYLKKRDVDVTLFHVFLIFHGVGSTKNMSYGYLLHEKLNSPNNVCSHLKFE